MDFKDETEKTATARAVADYDKRHKANDKNIEKRHKDVKFPVFDDMGGVKQESLNINDTVTNELINADSTHENSPDKVDSESNIEKYSLFKAMKKQLQPENILKTCYDSADKISTLENKLFEERINLNYNQEKFTQIKQDTLLDKELMAQWKEEFNITNDTGRLKKINEENKNLIELIEDRRKKIKIFELELAQKRRVFYLHFEVLKKTCDVGIMFECLY